MPQLNEHWYHKVTDHLFPHNCRRKLGIALNENTQASTEFSTLIKENKSDVIAALKNDRRTEGNRL